MYQEDSTENTVAEPAIAYNSKELGSERAELLLH